MLRQRMREQKRLVRSRVWTQLPPLGIGSIGCWSIGGRRLVSSIAMGPRMQVPLLGMSTSGRPGSVIRHTRPLAHACGAGPRVRVVEHRAPAGRPSETDDAELRQTFERFGTVLRAEITMDKDTGMSRGFGFVSFDTVMAADAAISARHNATISGKQLRVEKTSEDRAPGY